MVTLNKIPGIPVSPVAEMELKGLSSDEKPLIFMGKTVGENSLFLELDTGDLYYFTGGEWVKFGESGSGGGSGDEYETVAEIAVGTMIQGEGEIPDGWWVFAAQQEQIAVSEDETYYLNDAGHPSDSVVVVTGVTSLIMFNCVLDNGEIRQLDELKPSYIISNDNGETYIGVVSSDDGLSNTTVKILKKVSE